MSSHQSTQTEYEDKISFFSRTLHPEVEISEELMKLRESAHKKFVPAVDRARQDDAKQQRETSGAENLGKAGWILSELALRLVDLSKKRG
jgi:hypothetical protein